MKDRFFYWLKYNHGFSSKESRGFFVMIAVLVILGFSPSILRYFKDKAAEKAFLEFQHRIDSLENLQIQLVSSPLPTFNPQDTVRTNRNQKQLENINRIPFSEADSITLQIVPGIGQGTAGRIIKYRESLGGFYSQNQLLEVYGVKGETAQAVWEFFDFYPQVFRRIRINSASVEELSAHPYISYGEAKVLVAYRGQHGKFSSPDDLLKIKLFKSEWVEKIKPYLDFE